MASTTAAGVLSHMRRITSGYRDIRDLVGWELLDTLYWVKGPIDVLNTEGDQRTWATNSGVGSANSRSDLLLRKAGNLYTNQPGHVVHSSWVTFVDRTPHVVREDVRIAERHPEFDDLYDGPKRDTYLRAVGCYEIDPAHIQSMSDAPRRVGHPVILAVTVATGKWRTATNILIHYDPDTQERQVYIMRGVFG